MPNMPKGIEKSTTLDGNGGLLHNDCGGAIMFREGVMNTGDASTQELPFVASCSKCKEVVAEWLTEKQFNHVQHINNLTQL